MMNGFVLKMIKHRDTGANIKPALKNKKPS
jgi:hypothetical protein